jgi:hypothetical protein
VDLPAAFHANNMVTVPVHSGGIGQLMLQMNIDDDLQAEVPIDRLSVILACCSIQKIYLYAMISYTV